MNKKGDNSEEIDELARMAKEIHKLNPKYVLVTATRAIPSSIALKSALKEAYPNEEQPYFLFVDPRAIKEKENTKEFERRIKIDKFIREHSKNSEKEKILIYDETYGKEGETKPEQYAKGETGRAVRESLVNPNRIWPMFDVNSYITRYGDESVWNLDGNGAVMAFDENIYERYGTKSPGFRRHKHGKAGLEIKAIKLNPDEPFEWTSGYMMPIYNDNRMFLFNSEHRRLISECFNDVLQSNNISYDVIAGTSTAGISPGTTLADRVQKPLIYVRDKPKEHGLRNRIEGIDAELDLDGKKVILIEDLISKGGSSARAVQAIRDANGECNHCLSIFNYGFDSANQTFYDLNPECEVTSLLTYDVLLEVAKETGYINNQQIEMLEEWRADPWKWGEKHGFPKVEK